MIEDSDDEVPEHVGLDDALIDLSLQTNYLYKDPKKNGASR